MSEQLISVCWDKVGEGPSLHARLVLHQGPGKLFDTDSLFRQLSHVKFNG